MAAKETDSIIAPSVTEDCTTSRLTGPVFAGQDEEH